jgi:hypothetical protein
MSIYRDLLDKVERGAKYKINLVDKSLKIDGKEIELTDELLHEASNIGYCGGSYWKWLESLYSFYKRSVPSERHYGNKPYFKAVNVEELTDDEIAFNLPRNLAQFNLEMFVLCASLSGKLKWLNDKHWFYQGEDKELIVLREWV